VFKILPLLPRALQSGRKLSKEISNTQSWTKDHRMRKRAAAKGQLNLHVARSPDRLSLKEMQRLAGKAVPLMRGALRERDWPPKSKNLWSRTWLELVCSSSSCGARGGARLATCSATSEALRIFNRRAATTTNQTAGKAPIGPRTGWDKVGPQQMPD